MNRMRQRIAQRLKDAQNTYAMLTTFNEIDMTNVIEMRNTYKDAFAKKHNMKLGFMSPFVKATAYALQDQPVVNAVIDENEIIYRDYIDISVAVSTPKGLVVPVLRNVNHMNLVQIEQGIAALGEKVHDFRCCFFHHFPNASIPLQRLALAHWRSRIWMEVLSPSVMVVSLDPCLGHRSLIHPSLRFWGCMRSLIDQLPSMARSRFVP